MFKRIVLILFLCSAPFIQAMSFDAEVNAIISQTLSLPTAQDKYTELSIASKTLQYQRKNTTYLYERYCIREKELLDAKAQQAFAQYRASVDKSALVRRMRHVLSPNSQLCPTTVQHRIRLMNRTMEIYDNFLAEVGNELEMIGLIRVKAEEVLVFIRPEVIHYWADLVNSKLTKTLVNELLGSFAKVKDLELDSSYYTKWTNVMNSMEAALDKWIRVVRESSNGKGRRGRG